MYCIDSYLYIYMYIIHGQKQGWEISRCSIPFRPLFSPPFLPHDASFRLGNVARKVQWIRGHEGELRMPSKTHTENLAKKYPQPSRRDVVWFVGLLSLFSRKNTTGILKGGKNHTLVGLKQMKKCFIGSWSPWSRGSFLHWKRCVFFGEVFNGVSWFP